MFNNRNSAIDQLKNTIATNRPLTPHEKDQLKAYFRIGLTYSSNALEGNSLTQTETKIIIEDGLTIGGKSIREHLEVVGHSTAFDAMYKLAGNDTITEHDMLTLHALFYSSIDHEHAGRYRTSRIVISGVDHVFPTPQAVPDLMRTFIDSIPVERSRLHPVTFAAWLHDRFVNIHPFIDGNGRTARLLMNLALLQQGYVITIIPPLMRAHYLAALRKTNAGDTEPFYNFISEMVYESHKEYVRLLGL
jgi:Fic family protein